MSLFQMFGAERRWAALSSERGWAGAVRPCSLCEVIFVQKYEISATHGVHSAVRAMSVRFFCLKRESVRVQVSKGQTDFSVRAVSTSETFSSSHARVARHEPCGFSARVPTLLRINKKMLKKKSGAVWGALNFFSAHFWKTNSVFFFC